MKHFTRHRAFSLGALSALCVLLASAASADESPAFTGWKSASTNHFRFIFEDASRAQAAAFAAGADEAWNGVSALYGTPPEMTDALVTGRTDTVNAFAEGLSYYMGFYTNPPLSPEFGYREEWHRLFFTHELIHIANFSFEGKSSLAADVFGPFANYFNTTDIAGWYLEGLTTVLETELTAGGRGRSPFFELYCKALTLDNAFLDYNEIGAEAKAPRGQIYVMGYVLMRSIADRFGIGALADIERNRTGGRTFEESVRLVTGKTCDELFRDARSALLKKYAGERAIPEGITVSPRMDNTFYYRPALVGDRGILTIRDNGAEDSAAVRFDPATGEETVLFRGNFPDEYSLASNDAGMVVASLKSDYFDRLPGYIAETDLYAWTETAGLSRLTSGTSLFQPALSRSGSRLVAVELAGAQYRLVEIDPETGERKVLVESEGESCIQPALSADGSRIAFLMLDGKRAVLATAPMPARDFAYPIPQASITRSVNESGPIIDIANPSWTQAGDLLFASNERGRLEVWELKDGKRRPVVSDPAGAVWADRTQKGIWYASYASTGNVVKMKPESEWGKVPAFNGPSMPGDIVKTGTLASDFPDFNPFPEPVEMDSKKAAEKKPVPRKENGRQTETNSVMGGEMEFHNLPTLKLWLPTVGAIPIGKDLPAFGAGAFAVLTGYPLQNGAASTSLVLGGTVYPTIGQAEAFAFSSLPVFTGDLIVLGMRELAIESETENFLETTTGEVSYALPVESWSFYHDYADFAVVAGLSAVAGRSDETFFQANSAVAFDTGVNLKTGLDMSWSGETADDEVSAGRSSVNVMVSTFPSLSDDWYPAIEFDAAIQSGTTKMTGEISIRSRWFDYPANAPLPSTLVNLKGETLSCMYPGRTIIGAAFVLPGMMDTRLFAEKLISSGVNSAGMDTPENELPFNLTVDSDWYTGVELETVSGRNRIAFGVVMRLSDETFDPANDIRAYLTIKLDALTGSWPQ